MSLNEILKQVSAFKKEYNTVWFRGHSKIEYKLNSGLYRINKDLKIVRNAENNIFNCFINYGDPYCSKFHENKEWNTLFLMQHYGMYTRLLDWTDSFITALYFAIINKEKKKNACIWMLAPIELNKSCKEHIYDGQDKNYDNIGLITIDTLPTRIKYYKDIFESNIEIPSFAIVPRRSNERLISQNGFFTVQGTDGITLDEECKRYKKSNILLKIQLTEEVEEECKNFLDISGINYFSLYGGIDGLCKYIKDEFLKLKLENK